MDLFILQSYLVKNRSYCGTYEQFYLYVRIGEGQRNALTQKPQVRRGKKRSESVFFSLKKGKQRET